MKDYIVALIFSVCAVIGSIAIFAFLFFVSVEFVQLAEYLCYLSGVCRT